MYHLGIMYHTYFKSPIYCNGMISTIIFYRVQNDIADLIIPTPIAHQVFSQTPNLYIPYCQSCKSLSHFQEAFTHSFERLS